MFNIYIWNNPQYFLLLLLLVPLIVWYIFKHHQLSASIQVSDSRPYLYAGKSFKNYFKHLPFILRLLAFILLIIVLARPQSSNSWKNEVTKGIDIIISLDISGSMLAEDFKPNRIEAAKSVAIDFISGRPHDRIGLVVFSGESFTQCPITTDHPVLVNLFKDLKNGMLQDGTAIGMGLATAVARLKESKSISKVVILLTDGVNNAGSVPPLTAAEIARVYGVRVYTVGIGTTGKAPYPFQTAFGVQYQNVDVEIDEDVLRQISQLTGGKYFRATNNEKLREIYNEIDRLEKSRIDVRNYNERVEEYFIFALIAGLLLLTEFLIRFIILRNIP